LKRLDRSHAGGDATLLQLPEKAVQFGTGAFLRGFVEYYLDVANRAGLFNGRVVAVGSTGSGRDRVFNEQDGLYTLAVRGVDDGRTVNEYKLITSLSRALSAADEWDAVLELAHSPALELIFSNTTETGIQYDDGDEPGPGAPRSFPGKLARFLYERARQFDYSADSGVVVLPCELIEDNGARLQRIVLQIAQRWNYGDDFARWIEAVVPFCNTLVDRIVPGEPEKDDLEQSWARLGYRDDLLTVAEVYRLYAIEADAVTAKRLTFASAEPSIIVAEDIAPYRQRKVRLLNGTHSIMVPLALLAGCTSVSEALNDDLVGAYVRRVLLHELVPSADVMDAERFAQQVLDRFSNPYIRHALADITLQQTMKLRVRIVPAIADYTERHRQPPASIALGFAAYLLYIRDDNELKADDQVAAVRTAWRSGTDAQAVARDACRRTAVWGRDLNAIEGFSESVGEYLEQLLRHGARATLEQHVSVTEQA
jgi:tagaturonate reductase